MVSPGPQLRDEIALVLGATTPFLVRHLGGRPRESVGECRVPFQLIGELYVHGVMDGE